MSGEPLLRHTTSTGAPSATRLSLDEVVRELVVEFTGAGDMVAAMHHCVPAKETTAQVVIGGAFLSTTLGYAADLGYSWPIFASRPIRCRHIDVEGVPLLQRVAWMVEPGAAQPREVKVKTAAGARAGSPAPWAQQPAELVDQVLRGAHELNRIARECLGLDRLEVPYVLTPEAGASRVQYFDARLDAAPGAVRALRDLPRLVDALLEHGYRVVYGDLGYRTAAGYAQLAATARDVGRELELRVRQWHRAALLLTGHEQPWPAVREMRNLDNAGTYDLGVDGWRVPAVHVEGPWCRICDHTMWPACGDDCGHESCRQVFRARLSSWVWLDQPYRPEQEPHRFAVGVVCQADPMERRDCAHESCHFLREAWRRKWAPARCPWCGSRSLRMDPVSGHVHCLRPSCRDINGDRPVWDREHLGRLGLLIGTGSRGSAS